MNIEVETDWRVVDLMEFEAYLKTAPKYRCEVFMDYRAYVWPNHGLGGVLFAMRYNDGRIMVAPWVELTTQPVHPLVEFDRLRAEFHAVSGFEPEVCVMGHVTKAEFEGYVKILMKFAAPPVVDHCDSCFYFKGIAIYETRLAERGMFFGGNER